MKYLVPNFRLSLLIGAVATFSFLISCGNDDDPDPGPQPTGNETVYPLMAVGGSGISGTATFEELDDNSTTITISLTGDDPASDHPAHIHVNSAAEGGGIAIDLSNVMDGNSTTTVTETNDGTAITYGELIAFDGYINVHNSASELGTIVAQGDIGPNVLTGESVTYNLSAVSDPEISGTAVFAERASGETLITISLDGDAEDSDHPAHIHMNTAAEGGGIVIGLSNVQNGASRTTVSALNDDTPVTYEELLEFDGYINVHSSSANLGTLVAQGDIGQNALTGEMVVYELGPKTNPAISGTATFHERVNGETLIVLALTGTSDGGDHPAHLHRNDAATGGTIAIDLNNVNGASGMSRTNVAAFNDDTPVTYGELIDYNGYINVHNSSTDLGTLIAQGNIGSNAN